jgi:hypothetical protein
MLMCGSFQIEPKVGPTRRLFVHGAFYLRKHAHHQRAASSNFPNRLAANNKRGEVFVCNAPGIEQYLWGTLQVRLAFAGRAQLYVCCVRAHINASDLRGKASGCLSQDNE